ATAGWLTKRPKVGVDRRRRCLRRGGSTQQTDGDARPIAVPDSQQVSRLRQSDCGLKKSKMVGKWQQDERKQSTCLEKQGERCSATDAPSGARRVGWHFVYPASLSEGFGQRSMAFAARAPRLQPSL